MADSVRRVEIDAIADQTRDLLRELAELRVQGEALRREMENWCEEDQRPTLVEMDCSPDAPRETERHDTLRTSASDGQATGSSSLAL